MREILKGAFAQARVVHAVSLRETKTRFGQHRAGYLWALVEPLFWIATFGGMYLLVDKEPPNGMGLIPFLATGIIAYELFRQTAERGSQAISGNKALLFYPQVQPIDLIFARGALEAATFAMVFVVIIGGHALVQQQLVVDSVLTTLLGLGLAGLLGMSLGLFLCALGVVWPTVERLRGPLMRPLFWMSGLFYTAQSLPTRAREALLWNPVFHCVELVRDGWFQQYTGTHASPAYVLGWIGALGFAGLLMERAVRRRIELT